MKRWQAQFFKRRSTLIPRKSMVMHREISQRSFRRSSVDICTPDANKNEDNSSLDSDTSGSDLVHPME